MECSITRALVVPMTQHTCSAGVSGMQHRQRDGFSERLEVLMRSSVMYEGTSASLDGNGEGRAAS